MKKSDAIKLFGSTSALGRALGISPQAVSQWPERLPQRLIDQIVGAALRLGVKSDGNTGNGARPKAAARAAP